MYPKSVKCPKCDNLMRLMLFTDPHPDSIDRRPRPSVFSCSKCGIEVPASEVREVCVCRD